MTKSPLSFNSYTDYGIDQNYSAFKVEILDLDLKDADDYEAQYQSQRYKIFHSDIEQIAGGKFKLTLIIAQAGHTF